MSVVVGGLALVALIGARYGRQRQSQSGVAMAETITTVTCPPYVVKDAQNPCRATTTGAGLNASSPVTYQEVPGGVLASASYTGDATRLPSHGSALMVKQP